jgi:hypothetical protein
MVWRISHAQAALTELKLEFGGERDELRRRAVAAEEWRAADAAAAQQAHREAQLLRAQFQARCGLVATCVTMRSRITTSLEPDTTWCRCGVRLRMSHRAKVRRKWLPSIVRAVIGTFAPGGLTRSSSSIRDAHECDCEAELVFGGSPVCAH